MFRFLTSVLLLLAGIVSQSVVCGQTSENNEQKLSDANIKFNIDFYKTAAKDEKYKSFISSPFSVSTLFSMILAGAGGNTANQIMSTLGFEDAELTKDQVLASYKQILGESSQNTVGADIANSIWNSKNFNILKQYNETLTSNFKAQESELDFSSSQATDVINDWVKQETKGKIEKLFDFPLSPATVMVLVNAIYFKQSWKIKFSSDKTRDLPFFGEGTDSVIPMMNVKDKFPYYESDLLRSQVLELKYSDSNTSMVIILPKEELKSVESRLTYDSISDCFNALQDPMPMMKVNVSLPRFKIESSFQLVPIMQQLNLTDVFSSAADLSGISNENGLFVTEAVQKAFIEVNEEGTEAAAASGASLSRTIVLERTFNANHSFIFMIVNKINKQIYFMGRYA